MAAEPSHWIESSPDVLGGKPRIRGTRISVELCKARAAVGAPFANRTCGPRRDPRGLRTG